jgi:putative flippase GtrA
VAHLNRVSGTSLRWIVARAGYADARGPCPHDRPVSLVRGLYLRWQHLVHELAKFGIVGAIAYVIDVGMFNVFHTLAGLGPLTSKTLSTIIAATFAYLGNRHWSFRHRARTGMRREYSLYVVLNAVGLAIALVCLGFARYVLGLESLFALNIAANVIGTGLGTVFRFWAYKRYVFLHPEHPRVVNGSSPRARALVPAERGDEVSTFAS